MAQPTHQIAKREMHPSAFAVPSSASISKFITDHTPLSMLETKCTNMRDLHQLHSQIIKTGLAKDTIAISRVLAFCATSPYGDLNYAMLLFSHHPQPNAFMWNTLIRGLSRSSTPHLAISLFFDMLHSPEQPQRTTYPSLFVAYSHLGLAHHGAQLHGMVVKLGHASDPYIRNSMLSMYANCGHITEASRLFNECSSFDDVASWNSMIMGLAKNSRVDDSRHLFDEMSFRSVVTWSAMISGYVRNGRNKDALDLFHQMQKEGVKPNANTLVSLLGACAGLGALEQGEWIHACIEKHNIELNSIVITAIIDMYCKCGSIDKALKVFENASIKGLSSWNSMILGLGVHGRFQEAIQVFSRLQCSGLRPDNVTFVGILTACSHAGMVDEAMHYFSLMTDAYNIEPEIEHYGCMVDVLGRAGLLEEAEELIQRMPMRPDSLLWGSLLSACRIHGNAEIGGRAGARIMELDPRDSGGYVLLSNTFAGAGEFSDAASTRTRMKEKWVRKEPGCSMIEVEGAAHEFVAGGVLHPQAKEIYGVLNGLALELGSIG
ncbi:pentatricopeptide repeat-containing protein At2g42920, chloroplastic [Phoenix dactylifera]|uniref:Pentatricopeptide repeat-containing protein At2g42920, chloroplastic n=1 Tax=Phoenix dactylifera TaxID=42345 RepID=A0A8B7BH17_PHODC|nr:pentatricopeptide repeat-containing protein At2g42920, chloroplastic [Phoenix dactylifera]